MKLLRSRTISPYSIPRWAQRVQPIARDVRDIFGSDPVQRPWNFSGLTLALSACLLLAGCATAVPKVHDRTISTALTDPRATELGRLFQPEMEAPRGKSGVFLVPTGEMGFRARAGFSNVAEKTIDVQYYIWETDTTGSILAERILRAADRGVRVRMLLDHITTKDTDFKFARMDFHPNIEIRLFNPFANRVAHTLEFMFSIERLNHRMHNKAFIVDNAMAIVGGRNIGDNYFGVDQAANYRDLDLAVVGSVVQDISRSFDLYWNSEFAVPISAIIEERLSKEEFQERKARLYRWVEEVKDFPYPIDTSSDVLMTKLEEVRGDFIWAHAKALYDDPDKLETDEEEVADQLIQLGREQDHEIMIEAAYVVPGPEGVERGRLNKERGIRRRLLTNSLATTDVAAVHAAYAKRRRDLIKNGMEIYELRPDAKTRKRSRSLLAGRSWASLHTKAFVLASQTSVSQGLKLSCQPLTGGLALLARALDVVRLPTQRTLTGDSIDELFGARYVFLTPAVLRG